MNEKNSRFKDFFSQSFIFFIVILLLGGVITAVSQAKPNEPQLTLTLEDVFPTLTFGGPVDIANAGDDRLFIVEQRGKIHVVALSSPSQVSEFLDVPHPIVGGGEGGLLGLVFHPDYQTNGYFYVNYTLEEAGSLYTFVSRFQVSADPDVADPGSEEIIFKIKQPYTNHNAGDLSFGEDGYLYLGLGDGGSGGDPHNNSQTPQTLLGSMLRLDVDGGGLTPDCGESPANYTIPADNPYVADNDDKCNEIWAIGLRNPWRYSFDQDTNDLYIGDVGQGTWEEIDYQPAGESGLNYGWRCYEGNAEFNLSGCNPDTSVYTFPIAVYESNNGPCAVTGGFVYRGSRYSDLFGQYFYADYCSGQIWSLDADAPNSSSTLQLDTSYKISTFGEDVYGELYLADREVGKIYRVQGESQPNFLSVKKEAPLTAVSGEPITYTLTAINSSSTTTLTNVTITDTLPAGAIYVSGGSLSGDVVSWPAFELDPFSQDSVQFIVTAENTIINRDYRVTADDGYEAAGSPVATLIGDISKLFLPTIMKPE